MSVQHSIGGLPAHCVCAVDDEPDPQDDQHRPARTSLLQLLQGISNGGLPVAAHRRQQESARVGQTFAPCLVVCLPGLPGLLGLQGRQCSPNPTPTSMHLHGPLRLGRLHHGSGTSSKHCADWTQAEDLPDGTAVAGPTMFSA